MSDGIEFDLGTAVLSQYDVDGFLGISVDHYGDTAGGPPAEAHSAFGFAARPSDPDVDVASNPTNGCTLLYYREGKRYGAIAMSDPRHLPPQVTKGGSVQYCAVAGAYAKFDGLTGAYSVAFPQGQSGTFQAAGGPVITMDANGLSVGSSLVITPTGITAGGTVIAMDGSGLSVGPAAKPVALAGALAQLIQAVGLLATGKVSGVPIDVGPAVATALAAITQISSSTLRGSP